jgi:nicotinamide-nucleotide adenylyltransferase
VGIGLAVGFQLSHGIAALARISEGSAHGRFQPFHLGHLEYVKAAKEECDYLWVGITKYDVSLGAMNPLGTRREQPANNPFTYYERVKMITGALVEEGVAPSEFGFIPFPIETPGHLPAFLPKTVPCFTTICEEWNRQKIAVLEEAGYLVRVLWEKPKLISAAEVRESLIAGDELWRSKVPRSVAVELEAMNASERLRSIAHQR